ncbi:MFS transporter, partial [uncultured Varibaculum sp.]|uniref:MFS transporter n=1 Tax=uncultured Varibaculum sp. TaxID=413896 RepID=UPI0037DCEDA5
IAQDTKFGAGLGADVVSFWTLTPYAIAGLVMGPVAGTLAGRFGYRRVLRYGLIGALISLAILMFTMNGAAAWMLLVVSILAGLTYAGTVNIMLNGLGIVLSPSDNPGYLPGLNAGAFNLGAGISFAVLYAVMTSLGGGYGGHLGAIITGAILLLLALGTSFLIPKAAGQPAAAS